MTDEKRLSSGRGVSRVAETCFIRLTRVSNVEPFAYEDRSLSKAFVHPSFKWVPALAEK